MPPKKKKGKKKGDGPKKAAEKNPGQQIQLLQHQLENQVSETQRNRLLTSQFRLDQLEKEDGYHSQIKDLSDICAHLERVKTDARKKDGHQINELQDLVKTLRLELDAKDAEIERLKSHVKELERDSEHAESTWEAKLRDAQHKGRENLSFALSKIRQKVSERNKMWTEQVNQELWRHQKTKHIRWKQSFYDKFLTFDLSKNKEDLKTIGVRPLDF